MLMRDFQTLLSNIWLLVLLTHRYDVAQKLLSFSYSAMQTRQENMPLKKGRCLLLFKSQNDYNKITTILYLFTNQQ